LTLEQAVIESGHRDFAAWYFLINQLPKIEAAKGASKKDYEMERNSWVFS
jgi:hypothetical protein